MASRKISSHSGPSRRGFLTTTGGLLIGFSLADSGVLPALIAAETAANPQPGRLDAWLRIESDETVRVFTGKVDIGMGVETALIQVVAEELDMRPERVHLVMGDTAETPDQGGVGGSTSIATGAKPLRNAAATGRFLLMQLASARLNTPLEQLLVRDGIVSVKGDDSKSISYGMLAAGDGAGASLDEAMRVTGTGVGVNVEGKGKPKDPSTYKVVGQSLPRVDVAPKILGKAAYAVDVRVPGMLHGRVVRPRSAGASFVSVDESSVKPIPGYIRTVVEGNFVGVVAENEWAAIRAAKELKVEWSSPSGPFPEDLYSHMRAAKPKVSLEGTKQGDAATAMLGASKKLEASYEWPFQAHAMMGPGCAVVDFQARGVTTVWSGAQKPHALQKGLAEMLGLPADQMRVIWVEAAGSYGRAGDEDVAADAAVLSRAAGKPVRVQWSRADMTAWGGKGPAVIVDLAAGLDVEGKVTALQLTSRAFSGTEIVPQPDRGGNFLAAQLMGMANVAPGNEFVQWSGDTYAYGYPNVHSVGHIITPLCPLASPMRTTHLRDPNGPAGTFAGESFMDELAADAGADPIEFRLRYVSEPRARAVLEAVREHARWERRPSPKQNSNTNGATNVLTGRGVALGLRGGTYVATVAEIEVSLLTGAIRVKRLTCVHDCGLIINPDALRGTIRANLVQSLSRALKEEVTFDKDHVTSTDWSTYRVARWSDVPEVEIVLLNHPELPPTGAGEPSSRPTAAAINNAVFDATGARIRRAPLTPARVKTAIGKPAPGKAAIG